MKYLLIICIIGCTSHKKEFNICKIVRDTTRPFIIVGDNISSIATVTLKDTMSGYQGYVLDTLFNLDTGMLHGDFDVYTSILSNYINIGNVAIKDSSGWHITDAAAALDLMLKLLHSSDSINAELIKKCKP